jgi:5'-nucleotidase/UDP-sugar diphosphatase
MSMLHSTSPRVKRPAVREAGRPTRAKCSVPSGLQRPRETRRARSRRRIGTLAALAALVLLCSSLVTTPCLAQRLTSVTVLHTNDIHSHIAPRQDGVEPVGGMSRIAELVRRVRTAEPYVVLLDAGDFTFGTAFFSYYGGRAEIECMNAIGYDAAAVGNHELDRGPKALLDLSKAADFPFMSANLMWRKGGQPIFQPYVYLDVQDVTIALLALTAGDIRGRVRPSAVAPLVSLDPIETARQLVPELRKNASVVIVLSHIGIDEDKRLSEEVPGIDLIVGGDSHTLLEKPVKIQGPGAAGPTYIVQAGSLCRYLGRVDLLFSEGVLTDVRATVIPVRSVIPKDPEVEKIVGKYWNSVEKMVTKVVARAAGAFPRDASLRNGESPLGDLIADITREATGADFAIQNASGIRSGFGAGPVTVWDVYEALPFDNRLLTLELTGRQVRELAGEIARRLGRGSFCQVSGMAFEIESGHALGITIGGNPLQDGRVYTMGVVDYLAEGGDHYEILTKAKVLSRTSLYQRDVAVEYLKELKHLRPRVEGRIRVVETRG